MNTALKKILLIVLFTSLLSFPGIAFAADPVPLGKMTCAELNKPHSEFIISILEENIGTDSKFSKDDQTRIINCFRETKCIAAPSKVDLTNASPEQIERELSKKTCTSTYVDTCTPIENGESYCDRVQAIISLSGLSMLFSYIALIYKWAAGIVGVVSVMFMIYGSLMLMTAGDSTENVDKAKAKIIQSMAGLALLFLSAIILYTINPTFFTL